MMEMEMNYIMDPWRGRFRETSETHQAMVVTKETKAPIAFDALVLEGLGPFGPALEHRSLNLYKFCMPRLAALRRWVHWSGDVWQTFADDNGWIQIRIYMENDEARDAMSEWLQLLFLAMKLADFIYRKVFVEESK